MKKQNSFTILTIAVLSALCMSACAKKYSEPFAVPETVKADIEIENIGNTGFEADDTIQLEEQILDAELQKEEIAMETEDMLASQDIHLLFSGDVLLSNYVLSAYENAGGMEGVLDENYRGLIEETDFFFVNEEFPFSNRGTQAPDKQYTFRLPPEKVHILQEMGVDGVSLANNHALDFGVDALLDTCQVLDDAGIDRTGAGASLDEAKKAVEVVIQDKKIAIIGATRVIPVAEWATHGDRPGMLATYDPAILLEEIKELDAKHDYVIVFVHWGVERADRPEEYQRNMGKMYIDAGADLVIGAHPHVLQGIEYYQGVPIVYSLGNFVFGSSIPKTMLLEVILNPVSLRLKVHPGTSSSGYTRMITDSQEKETFYDYLESISYGVSFEDGNVMPQP